MVAWTAGVTEGDEPTVARPYQVPWPIRAFRFGQALGQVRRTMRPPPSHTIVTTSLGGSGRSPAGTRASDRGASAAPERPKPRSSPNVGTTAAAVTGRWTATPGR